MNCKLTGSERFKLLLYMIDKRADMTWWTSPEDETVPSIYESCAWTQSAIKSFLPSHEEILIAQGLQKALAVFLTLDC